MSGLRAWLSDLGRLIAAGVILAGAASLLLFAIGLVGGHTVLSGLSTAKSGCFVIGALCLFFLAGLLLTRGKHPEKATPQSGWRKKFSAAGYCTAAAVMAVCFLGVGSAADYLLRLM